MLFQWKSTSEYYAKCGKPNTHSVFVERPQVHIANGSVLGKTDDKVSLCINHYIETALAGARMKIKCCKNNVLEKREKTPYIRKSQRMHRNNRYNLAVRLHFSCSFSSISLSRFAFTLFHHFFSLSHQNRKSLEIYKHAKYYTWVHWNYLHGSPFCYSFLKCSFLFKTLVRFVCSLVRSLAVCLWFSFCILFLVCIDVVTAPR